MAKSKRLILLHPISRTKMAADNGDAALREQILDVTKAECEPEIEPNRLMYNLGRNRYPA
jgi:hypothetical protein